MGNGGSGGSASQRFSAFGNSDWPRFDGAFLLSDGRIKQIGTVDFNPFYTSYFGEDDARQTRR